MRGYQPPTIKHKPPRQPRGLTGPQVAEWKQLIDNPAIEVADEALLLDYVRSMKVRDKAAADIQKRGVEIKGRANPVYYVLRSTQTHILKLRKVLAMNIKERNQLRRSTSQPPQEDGGMMD